MDADALIDRLADEGARLATAAAAAGWDAPVPGLDWDVRALVAHTGGVHRWAGAIVAGRPEDAIAAAHDEIATGPAVADAGLASWYADGLAGLVAALRAAPDDLSVLTLLRGVPPREFWARRQAHETAVHRADAARAAGDVATFDPGFAQDGIVEIAQGFAARRSFRIAAPGVLGLRATDAGPDWRLTFGGERTVAEPGASLDGADAVVSGTSGDLYLWLWNRPSRATVTGDAAAAARWEQTVRVVWD